jgi:protein-glucosylgalactosylhydroxylysine glucosidase
MAAARVGLPELAVDLLLRETKENRYAVNGINAGWYFPGNGGLLYAVAMMAAGWDGAPDRKAPGFPDNGRWVVKWEGLKRAL